MPKPPDHELSVCTFSPDQLYRYRLLHIFDPEQPSYVPLKVAMWVMANPSVANQTQLDSTLRRCKSFSRAWGYTAMLVCNAYGLVSTDPAGLKLVDDPVGPENDDHIAACARREDVGIIVAGWGRIASATRVQQIVNLLPDRLSALKVNKDGSAAHPLYLKATLTPQPYARAPIQPTPSLLPPPALPDPTAMPSSS